jgi:hypothetical protein
VIEHELFVVVQLPIESPLTVKEIDPSGLPVAATVAVRVTRVLITTGDAEVVTVVVVGLFGAAAVGAGNIKPLIVATATNAAIFFTIHLRYLVRYIDNGRDVLLK